MGWTASIQKITEKREADWFASLDSEALSQSDFMKNDKTTLDQFKEGWQIGSGRAVGDEIEGLKALGDKETWENMAYAALHPINTLKTMYNVLSDSYIKNVKNGDFEDAVIWFGYGATQLAIGALFDKGIGKIATVAKGIKFAKVTEVTAPRIQQTFTNLADSLSLENRLALADMGGLNLKSSFDSTAFEAEEKLSTYQFARGVDTNAVKPGDTSPLAPEGEVNVTKGGGKNIPHPVLDNTRSGSALKKPDGQHGFNDIIDNYTPHAKEFEIVGGDGVKRKLYQIEGGMKYYDYKDVYNKDLRIKERITTVKDQNGIFEWIVDPTKGVTHRRFIPNGKITGYSNQRP